MSYLGFKCKRFVSECSEKTPVNLLDLPKIGIFVIKYSINYDNINSFTKCYTRRIR